jgi:hypothetical protein
MSDAIAIALIAAVPGTVASILGLINRAHLRELTISVNGNLKKLLETSNAAANSEGRLAEQSDQRDRDAAKQTER